MSYTINQYPSQIGQKEFFWIRDVRTGDWILGRCERFKNGRWKSGWVEQKRLVLKDDKPEPPEEKLLKMFSQQENDLLFQLASGDRPKPR